MMDNFDTYKPIAAYYPDLNNSNAYVIPYDRNQDIYIVLSVHCTFLMN